MLPLGSFKHSPIISTCSVSAPCFTVTQSVSKPVPATTISHFSTPVISTPTMTSQSKAMSSKVSRDPKGVWKVKAEPIIRRSQPSELEMLNAPATGTCISPEVEEYIENNLENEREEIRHALISFNLVMKELHDKFSKSRADIPADHAPINCLGCSGSTPANNLLISEEVDQQNNFVPLLPLLPRTG